MEITWFIIVHTCIIKPEHRIEHYYYCCLPVCEEVLVNHQVGEVLVALLFAAATSSSAAHRPTQTVTQHTFMSPQGNKT